MHNGESETETTSRRTENKKGGTKKQKESKVTILPHWIIATPDSDTRRKLAQLLWPN